MKVIVIGSGPSAKNIIDYDIGEWKLATINNAWKIRNDWDYGIYADDMPNDRPPYSEGKIVVTGFNGPQNPDETLSTDQKRGYHRALKELGTLGITMFFAATYWVIWYLKPDTVGFIGCDMDYTPTEDGSTHFYGVGHDIKERGIPDPNKALAETFRHEQDPVEHGFKYCFDELTRVSQERCIKLINFSDNEKSRLPYRKERLDKYFNKFNTG